MNQNNLEYLQKSLDYLGFGTKLNASLEAALITVSYTHLTLPTKA